MKYRKQLSPKLARAVPATGGMEAPPCSAPGMLKALHTWDCTQELRDDPGMCVR